MDRDNLKPRFTTVAYLTSLTSLQSILSSADLIFDLTEERPNLTLGGWKGRFPATETVRRRKPRNFTAILDRIMENIEAEELGLVLSSKNFWLEEDPSIFVQVQYMKDGLAHLTTIRHRDTKIEVSITFSFHSSLVNLSDWKRFELAISSVPGFSKAKSWYSENFFLNGEPLSFIPNNLTKVRLGGDIEKWNEMSDWKYSEYS